MEFSQAGMPEVWFPHLGITIGHMNHVAFQIFGIPVYWYGVMIGLGMAAGYLLMIYETKRTEQKQEDYIDFALFALFFSIIGARLYYVVFLWDNYKGNLLHIFNIREGGLAIYGGVLTAILCAVIFTRRRKIDFFQLADTLIPSLIIGQIFGRWGNFFNREAFGGYTNNLFAMRYLKTQVRPSDLTPDILRHIVEINGIEYIQVHPTFLYESLWNLGVLFLLLYLQRKKKVQGSVFACYLIGYGVGRFWIESLRTDQLLLWGTNIAVSQIVSVGLMILGIGIFFWQYKKGKSKNLPKNG